MQLLQRYLSHIDLNHTLTQPYRIKVYSTIKKNIKLPIIQP